MRLISDSWQQLEVETGEVERELRRRISDVAAPDQTAFADAIGMDRPTVSNALSAAVRGDGRRKSIIPIEAALIIVRMPLGERVAELIAGQAGYLLVEDSAPTEAEELAARRELDQSLPTEWQAVQGEKLKRTIRRHRKERAAAEMARRARK